MKTTVLVKLDSKDPNLIRLREVAQASREGKIVAFPTETVYGMGAPMSAAGVTDQLIQIKRRNEKKPFSYHIGDWEMLDILKVRRTPAFRFLARRLWPGPVTLLVTNEAGEKIGLRFPRHRLAAALINSAGEPFIATSANVSNAPSPRTAEEVMRSLGGQIDYLIDGGKAEYAEDSTVVDVTVEPPAIVRRGALAHEVEELIQKIKSGRFPWKRILLVCTGNSCRSPMGAGWMTAELRRKGLVEEIEVSSCGVSARIGMPATPEAIFVMKNREIDISAHRSRPCSRQDILDADLILAMSPEHTLFITGMVPSAKGKIKVLDVADPIGMGMMVYEDVIKTMEKKLKEEWKDIIA